jgi:hypothetical protein
MPSADVGSSPSEANKDEAANKDNEAGEISEEKEEEPQDKKNKEEPTDENKEEPKDEETCEEKKDEDMQEAGETTKTDEMQAAAEEKKEEDMQEAGETAWTVKSEPDAFGDPEPWPLQLLLSSQDDPEEPDLDELHSMLNSAEQKSLNIWNCVVMMHDVQPMPMYMQKEVQNKIDFEEAQKKKEKELKMDCMRTELGHDIFMKDPVVNTQVVRAASEPVKRCKGSKVIGTLTCRPHAPEDVIKQLEEQLDAARNAAAHHMTRYACLEKALADALHENSILKAHVEEMKADRKPAPKVKAAKPR